MVNKHYIENKQNLLSLQCKIKSNHREIERLKERLSKIPEEIESLQKLIDNDIDPDPNTDIYVKRIVNITYLKEDLNNFPEFIKNLKAELFDLEKEYKKEKLK